MKLVIQIPCFNEQDSLPITLKSLPKKVEGFDEVKWLVIDDGSTDDTAEVARRHGALVVSHNHNKGLAQAFMTGLETALLLGADVIVNTDADNQYDAACIPDLARPILEGKAEIVVGARPIERINHFSCIKKTLQKLGSFVVRMASGTEIPDAPSGFRAISREAALKTNVFSDYTYTLETIIQAGQKNMTISSVPIRVNDDLRPSRLVKNIFMYVFISLITIIRIFVIYRPFYFCVTAGAIFFIPGIILGLRFLYYLFLLNSSGHIQSLILSSILLGIGFQIWILGFLADSMAVNRKISEEIQYIKRKSIYCNKEL
jgi:glycosyltransferase involved in cell wall biosynthesis